MAFLDLAKFFSYNFLRAERLGSILLPKRGTAHVADRHLIGYLESFPTGGQDENSRLRFERHL